MAKQQSTQKLQNELNEAIKTSIELLGKMNDIYEVIDESARRLKEGFKGIDKNTTKGLSEFNKLLAQTNKLTVEHEKLKKVQDSEEQKLIKNQQELAKLRKIEIQTQQAELRLQKQIRTEQDKALKEAEKLAKQQKEENSAYSKKSKQLNELRKQYKDLAAAEKENTKEAKKLLKQITSLDKELKKIDETVGQNQRSVGDYGKAIQKLNGTIGKLGITAVLVKGVELLTSAFGDSRNGAEAFELAMVEASATLQVMGKRVGKLGNDLIKIFRSDDYIWEKFDDGINSIIDSFSGMGEEITTTTDQMKELVGISTEYRIEIERLERSVAVLNRTYTTNLQIAENDTLSFERREEASKRARAEANQLIKKETELANKRLELAAKEIGVKINLSQKEDELAIDYAERVRARLKIDGNARKISQEEDESFTQAFLNYQTTRLESTDRYIDTLEKQNKLYSDKNELQLDLQLDLLDNEKTINERRIASDRETFEERKRLLEESTKDFEKLFGQQLQTIIDQRKQVIDTEIERLKKSGELNAQEIKNLEAQKELLTVENLRKIAAEGNVEEQIKLIQNLKLGEKFTLRYSEVIRDHNTGVQDLTDTQDGLNDSMVEYENILKDIELQEKKLADASFDIDEARREQEEKDLRDRIENTKKGTLERAKLEQELNELLLEKQEELNEKDDENTKKRLEKRKELIEESIAVIEQVFDKANEKRTKQIEDELSATEKRINDIQRSAELGNEAAQQSLAAEERKQAELERKKEQQRRREQRQEMLIAGLNLLSENADNPNALGKSISDVAALVSIVSSLPTYLKGTEDTGNGGNLDANGGFLSVLHPNERVLTKEQNKALGGLTNEEVAELGRLHNMGAVEYSPVVAQSNKVLESKVDEMTKAIQTLHERIPIQKVDYNAKAKEYEHRIESNNKTEILRRKARGLWR